jgi:hypothetical protein
VRRVQALERELAPGPEPELAPVQVLPGLGRREQRGPSGLPQVQLASPVLLVRSPWWPLLPQSLETTRRASGLRSKSKSTLILL